MLEVEQSGPGQMPAGLLRDAFDNTEIAVLTDRNLDGLINAADSAALACARGPLAPIISSRARCRWSEGVEM